MYETEHVASIPSAMSQIESPQNQNPVSTSSGSVPSVHPRQVRKEIQQSFKCPVKKCPWKGYVFNEITFKKQLDQNFDWQRNFSSNNNN